MKYLRRFLWFLTVRMFGLCVVSALLIAAFYMSMNITNIVILLKDGMAARAQVILGVESDDAQEDLAKYFTEDCLLRDAPVQKALAGTGVYQDYDVTGLDHRLTVEWLWSWPWEDTASATIAESVPAIDGKIKSALRQDVLDLYGEERLSPPKWGNARIRVMLVRIDGRWKIASLTTSETWE